MGIALPQLAPASEDRVSGAQVVDGTLRFNDNKKHYLTQTIGNGTSGFTISCWMKPCQTGNRDEIFDTVASTGFYLYRHQDGTIRINDNTQALFTSNGYYRDTGAFYNIVFSYDSTSGYGSLYVNGRLDKTTEFTTQLYAGTAKISSEASNDPANYYLGQWYLIDGQALGPGYFGYTDPLTNTWRPKKFKSSGTTVNDGTRWRTYLTASNGSFHADPYGADAAFNGVVGSGDGGYCQAANGSANPNSITFDVSSIGGIPFKNSVEVWLINNANTVSVNGGPAQSLAGTTFVTVARGPGVLNTIKFERPSTNGASLGTIRVDGVNLRDDLTQNLDFGSEGFYLPLDGNTPIGEDQSGKGNDWTPMNFGGSTEIAKATGAFPVLNTGQGGSVGRPGVFGSDVSVFYTTTSATNSGGKYVFENEGTQPTFSFIRGATYTFDYSASTGHPLRFATAADAAGSTEYTDGTSVSGNVISFTVPHNAPNTLYYYCTNHGGMGNSINVTTDITKADPYAWKNVLAMPLVGGSGVDLSSQINATTSAKAATVTSASDSSLCNFYGSSMNFDGSNDKLDVADSTDFDVETGDWCAECWFYTPSSDSTSQSIFRNYSADNSQFMLGINSLQLFGYLGNTQIINAGTDTAISAGEWAHLALTHDDSVGDTGLTTLYINGIARATNSSTSVPAANHNGFFLGHNTTHGSRWITGNYQDVRFYKGTKKYTGNFIPASAKPDVLPDSPSGVFNKSNLTKITDGAVGFDGSGDYLATYVSSSDFTFGTGDFTIEMFLYNEETGGKGFIQFSDSSGGLKATSSGVVTIHKDAGLDGVFRAYAKNTSTGFTSKVPYKRWCHVALTRESGTIKLFVDGKQDATTITEDTTNYATTYVVIGGYYDTNYLSKCNISNVRVNKGTAVYTKDFTPPTSALTNISGTKLLCCQSNTEPGSAAVGSNVTGVNSGVQWSAGAGPNFEANNPARDGFNGVVDSNTRTAGGAVTAKVTLPVPVAFSSTLKVRGARDSGNGLIKITGGNGEVDVSSQFTSSSASLETVTITGVTSPLKAISLTGNASSQPRFSAIYIDDVMLVDPLTPYGDVSVSSNTHERNSATTFNPFNNDINTVRGQEGSYVTLNGHDPRLLTNGPTYTLSNGNLTCDMVGGNTNASGSRGFAASTIDLPNGGKWYCEYYMDSLGNNDIALGIAADDVLGYYIASGNPKPGAYLMRASGIVYNPIEQLSSDSFREYVTGDLVGVAVDLVDPKITFYKNGRIVYSHSVDPGQGPFKFVIGCDPGGSTAYKTTANFGQKPFKFSPPDGFQPLTSATVMPDTVISRSKKYFSTTLYKGNGASSPGGSGGTQTIDVGHKPDLVWIKDRTQAHNNNLIDSVNGAPNLLMSDAQNQLVTDSTDGLTAFDVKGFNLGDNGAGTQSLEMNKSGNNYVAWTWKAGGNKGTFNIDDVDVGSAANAKMSVGSLNNDVYDTSQTWSNYLTASGGSGFTNQGQGAFAGYDDSSNYTYVTGASSGTNYTMTFTPPTPIRYTDSVVVRVESTNSEVSIDGGTTYVADSAGVVVFEGPGTLTSLICRDSRGQFSGEFNSIRVDGVLLVNNGTTPPNAPSLASTACSVGTKQGFSIIKWTGNRAAATVSHGLNSPVKFYFVKNLTRSSDWITWHTSLPGFGQGFIRLNTTGGAGTATTPWNSQLPTNKTFSLGADTEANGDGEAMIAYLWSDVPGLQKFGTYAGISSSDGPFIELGFRPSMIMLKKIDNTDSNSGWHMYDNQRNTYNPANNFLLASDGFYENRASNDSADVATYTVDFLSTGFKMRHNSNNLNDGGSNYIYCAWAETPSFNLFGATANAR